MFTFILIIYVNFKNFNFMYKKSINFAAVMFMAALTIGLASCNKYAMLNSAQDAEHGVIARSPMGGDYSDYIITPEEALIMVANDLIQSGGEFARKQVDYVEPLLFSDFEFELGYFEELERLDIIKMSDPLAYIVYFDDDGYALMTCDKDFGVEIMHVQTGGTITKDEATTPLITLGYPEGYEDPYNSGIHPHLWADLLVARFKEQYGWKEVLILNNFQWRFKYCDDCGGGSHISTYVGFANEWATYHKDSVKTSFWLTAGELNEFGTIGTLAPAVLEFLGYFENPSTLFGITGNWSAIKSWHSTTPAPQWAWEIQNYCTIALPGGLQTGTIFGFAKNFLVNECNGYYSSADVVQLIHDEDNPSSGAITDKIAEGKPVLVNFNSKTGLAHKEWLQKDLQYTFYFYSNGATRIPTGRERYSSIIFYKVSLQNEVMDCKTNREALAQPGASVFKYIAY